MLERRCQVRDERVAGEAHRDRAAGEPVRSLDCALSTHGVLERSVDSVERRDGVGHADSRGAGHPFGSTS